MTISTAPSWQDLYDLGRATLIARNDKLKVNVGDVTDAVIAGAASMASMVIAYAAGRFLATFLNGAAGQDLANLARDRGVIKDEGDKAIGPLTFARSGGGAAFTILAGTRVATDVLDSNGQFQIYTTDTDVVFSLGDNGPHSITGTCTKVGGAGNVAIHTITRIIDTVGDSLTTVTNNEAFAGGSEEESDEDLRDRVRGFFLTEARGTIDALVFGAKSTPGAGVKRVNVVPDYITGIVTVYVSDAEGNANTAMADAVRTELINHWADAGDPLDVVAAVLVVESIDLSLTVRTGIDVAALLTRVRDSVIARVQRLAPGETLYRDMISAAARDVDRDNILSVVVNSPAANITPTGSQVIRTDVAHVTFT